MPERTIVVSGTNVLARGFLLVPTDRRTRGGEPANGLFAVARAVRRVVEQRAPERAVAVLEAGGPKAGWPEILAAQRAPLNDLLSALGFPVLEGAGELHLVASYARAAREAGQDVTVVGVDKRFAQLVGEGVWWYDANKDVRYNPEIVLKRFGVPPSKVAEWLGLVGDEDSLPGVAGIGAKGATALLEKYGSVQGALADLGAIGGRTGNALRAAREAIPQELARARLDERRALPLPLEALRYRAPSGLNETFERLGFLELLVAQATSQTEAAVAATAEELTLPGGDSSPTAVDLLLDETGLAGVGLATGSYVPRESAAWPRLTAWLTDSGPPKLVHDAVTTTAELHKAGVLVAGIVADSMAASHLTQPSNWAPHELSVVSKLALGRALPGEEALRGVGVRRRLWGKVPAERAAEFAVLRAETAQALWAKLSPVIAPGLVAEYLELSATLVRMEERGILVDREELAGAEREFTETEGALAGEIESLAGHPFNINSSPQLGKVLFEELKLPVVSHTKTGWSTSIEALTRIEHAHPIVPRVLRWRALRRLKDNWIESLRRQIHPDGRVHSRFHPARSFSGDLVNTAPDLSRVPGRTPEMARIRRAFVAPPGHLLVSVDFHQLGLYVLAHLTRDPALVEPLREGKDMHRLTASAILEKPEGEVTPDERQIGKVVNFATFAGQGASALSMQLGIPPAEAREMIARFDRRYAGVRAFQEEQFRLAKDRGYLVTISGRRWPIGGLESLDPHDRSYAERLARRGTHEGSVADVSRRALLHADRALRGAGLSAAPVHHIVDEALFEVPEAELARAARLAAEAMQTAYPLEVPLVVGVEAGRNWADLERLELGGS